MTFRVRIQFDDFQGHEDFIMEIEAFTGYLAMSRACEAVSKMFKNVHNVQAETV